VVTPAGTDQFAVNQGGTSKSVTLTLLSAAIASAVAGVVPVGGIIMWSGTIATIPAGWALCDGTSNSPGPDLRDSFVVGARSDSGGVAKTNLTGSLTQSGGSVSHHHADHTLSTNVAVSSHTLSTNVAVGAPALTTNVAISSHSLSTSVALSAHTLSTNVAVGAPALTTNVAVSAHTLSTNVGAAVATVASAASGTTRNVVVTTTVTLTQPVVAAHAITQPVVGVPAVTQPVINAHSITQPAFSDHAITQPVVGAPAVTQPVINDHAITQPVVSAHDTLSAPQPYYALAFIQRMT